MAVQVPLNRFRRAASPLRTANVLQPIYTVPFDRAAILLASLATNLSAVDQTVTIAVSSTKAAIVSGFVTPGPDGFTYLVNRAKIGGFDSANLTIGKVVLVDGDQVYASCSVGLSSVHLTLSILEAVNSD